MSSFQTGSVIFCHILLSGFRYDWATFIHLLYEAKMNKNRMFLGVAVLSLLIMGLAVFRPLGKSAHVNRDVASDFYQRHPDWIWTANRQNDLIPVTGDAAYTDYFQRHPELSNLAELGQGASDYFERHPELIPTQKSEVDLTDYYFRHLDH